MHRVVSLPSPSRPGRMKLLKNQGSEPVIDELRTSLTAGGTPSRVISGNCPLTTDGLGITPGNQFSLVQATETPEESQLLAAWFTQLWGALPATADGKSGDIELSHVNWGILQQHGLENVRSL